MQPAAYFAPIRQIWSKATCRVRSNHFSPIFSVSAAKKGYRQGPGSGNLGESLVKATISQRQYQYQNHWKITQKKTNFLCIYPLLVLGPDLDPSQDSRKVSQGIFQKIPKLTKLQMGKDLCLLDSNNYRYSTACTSIRKPCSFSFSRGHSIRPLSPSQVEISILQQIRKRVAAAQMHLPGIVVTIHSAENFSPL